MLSDNEPELQRKYGCIGNASWVDHLRIRTAALRAVYADMNTDTQAGRKLSVYAAPFSVASRYNNSLAQLSVQVLPESQMKYKSTHCMSGR